MTDIGNGRLLALDCGTSSARALVTDATGEPIPDLIARRKVTLVAIPGGGAVIDADAYLAGLVACLDELHERRMLDGIRMVAACSQWHSILAADASGKPLGPMLTWADTRAAVTPDGPVPADPDAFHQRTGTWLHSLYWSARIPWLRQQAGGAPVRFLGLPEYLFGNLLGDYGSGVSIASGTGLLDLAARTWDTEALELAGTTAAQLPSLLPADWTGTLAAEWAARWPELAGAPWTSPIGDGAASAVGSGCTGPGRVSVTVGTSAAVRAVQPDAVLDGVPPLAPTLWRYRLDVGRVVTGAAYSAGGGLHAWAGKVVLPPGTAADGAADRGGAGGGGAMADPDSDGLAQVPPGARGVTALPFLAGTRPPFTLPAGSGVLAGLSLSTTAADIRAALLEGVCFETSLGLATLEQTIGLRAEVVLGGGAVHASPAWARRFAAAYGRPVQICAHPEVGARGAALAALGSEDPPPYRTVTAEDAEIEAMAEARDLYLRLRERFLTDGDGDGTGVPR